ncbi:amino acid ABC transporter permease [Ferviditalea candida]|uniref:Amino acid ABC transporter permease n=1 Tax=Ferviditalea candida TaxID=3108399 RepID=A0ABU5ZMK2_9BACL|nr:amino acid ABC transporter permease [Paenibacillaceae bacterium T2]
MDFAGAYAWPNIKYILQGLFVTLEVSLYAITLSFVLGSILASIRYSRVPGISHAVGLWVESIRNLPLLLIIFFAHFALPEVGLKMNVFVSTVVALTVFESAMISEIVRSGLNSIDKGQTEAGRASGLTYLQTLWHIVLPQALRRMVPPMISQFIALLKDTSLAVIVALPELFHNMSVVKSQNVNYTMPMFLLVAVLYFTVNFSLSQLTKRMELKS